MELLRKVLTKGRLPIIEDTYIVEYKEGYSAKIEYKHFIKHIIEADWENNVGVIKDFWLNKLEAWYEPITVELESEKILPIETRVKTYAGNYVNLVFEALEAAELGNMLLNSELSVYRERDEIMVNKLIKATQDADERYNEALNFAVNELGLINSDASEINGIKTLLKLAAYGK